MKIDYTKFFNAWFFDNDINLIPLNAATKLQASTLGAVVEYNFTDVPDLPLTQLVEHLILGLPQNFIFVKSIPTLLSNSLEHLCKRIGRTDIEFIYPYMDIDQSWYEEYKNKILFFESGTVHESFTLWKLSQQGKHCGLVGQFVQLADLGIVKKTSLSLQATEPNWKVFHPTDNFTYRQLAEHCNENLIFPNFVLLLARAFIKQIDLDHHWLSFRMMAQNKIGTTALAIGLSPCIEHDFRTIVSQENYPRYPGLITRKTSQIIITALDSMQ